LNTWIRVCCPSNRLSQQCRKACNFLTFFSSEDPFSGPYLQPVPGHCWRGVQFSGLGVGAWISVLGVLVIGVQPCLLQSLHFVKSWSSGCVANRSWDEGATSQLSSGAWKHSIYGGSAKYWYKSPQSTLINHNSSWVLSPNLLDMQQDGEIFLASWWLGHHIKPAQWVIMWCMHEHTFSWHTEDGIFYQLLEFYVAYKVLNCREVVICCFAQALADYFGANSFSTIWVRESMTK
jgi:hypothetical protein